MGRRIAAIACVATGTWLLAGPGWALLVLGVLVEVGWPGEQPAWFTRAVGRLAVGTRGVVATARAVPTQLTAAGSVVAGVALIPAGMGLVAGVGAALLALGVLTLGLGLLLDRTA